MSTSEHTASVPRPAITAATGTAYIGTILAANWLTNRYHTVWVAPGLITTAGTYAAGLALLARDALQETAGRRAVLAAIAIGAALSAALAGVQLAVASAVAFGLSELLDMAVYTPLRRRGWARAVLASNTVGAVVDTFVFLTLAGFPLTGQIVGGQIVGKLAWATLLPVAVVAAGQRARAVRQAVVAE